MRGTTPISKIPGRLNPWVNTCKLVGQCPSHGRDWIRWGKVLSDHLPASHVVYYFMSGLGKLCFGRWQVWDATKRECSSRFLIWSQDYFLWSLFHLFSDAFVCSYTHSFNKQYILKWRPVFFKTLMPFDFPGTGKGIWVTCEFELLMSSSAKASEVPQIYLFPVWLPGRAVPSSGDAPMNAGLWGVLLSPGEELMA